MLKPILLAMVGAWFAAVFLDAVGGPSAVARPQYKKALDTRYVKQDSHVASEVAFANRAKTAGCAVCHAHDAKGKMEKSVRNAYGNAFGEKLGRKNTQDGPRINRALDAAARTKADAKKSPQGDGTVDFPTFGDRISAGKLPIGDE